MKATLIKKKKQSITALKERLWKVFATYIKNRDGWSCFTCGRRGEGSAMHAGHFIPKSVGGIALYFDERNVHAQCYHCNINLGGNQYVYGKRLGEIADELYHIKNIVMEKWNERTYEAKIAEYEDKVRNQH